MLNFVQHPVLGATNYEIIRRWKKGVKAEFLKVFKSSKFFYSLQEFGIFGGGN